MSRITAATSNYAAIVERAASMRKAKAQKLQANILIHYLLYKMQNQEVLMKLYY